MDPIGDLLSQIKNAYLVNKKSIEAPWSKNKEALVDLLIKNGFLKKVEVKKIDKLKKNLLITLKYDQQRNPALKEAKRISKPGRRLYSSGNKIPWLLSPKGRVIISTSQGLMTGRQARKKNIGGELICQVW